MHYVETKRWSTTNEKTNDTLYKVVGQLNVYFEFFFRRGYLKRNVVKLIQRPKRNAYIPFDQLSLEEESAFLAVMHKSWNKANRSRIDRYLHYRNNCILFLILRAGLNSGQVIRMDVDDINFARHGVPAQKPDGEMHFYYLSDEVEAVLKQYLNERAAFMSADTTDALFLTMTEKRINTTSIRDAIASVQKRVKALADRKITAQVLRATYIGDLIRQTNFDIPYVCDVMGITSDLTIRRYLIDPKPSDLVGRRNLLTEPRAYQMTLDDLDTT